MLTVDARQGSGMWARTYLLGPIGLHLQNTSSKIRLLEFQDSDRAFNQVQCPSKSAQCERTCHMRIELTLLIGHSPLEHLHVLNVYPKYGAQMELSSVSLVRSSIVRELSQSWVVLLIPASCEFFFLMPEPCCWFYSLLIIFHIL